MSEGFYKSFFPADASDAELLAGITQFRAYAMLRFGGFLPAYRTLAPLPQAEIHTALAPYNGDPAKLRENYARRSHGQDLIREHEIPDAKRWYLGYISDRSLLRDLMKEEALRWKIFGRRPARSPAAEVRRQKKPEKYDADVGVYHAALHPATAVAWRKRINAKRRQLEDMSEDRSRIVAIGERNSAAYLAASHVDVYVATSMRESWEYEAMARVARDIFSQPEVKTLNLTMFDPTLSYYESRYDKGLVEGLMLNRANVTIYMVQETDTLGKDSELAATLAYGRPVIAYVPQYDKADLVAELKGSGLRRTFTRLLMLSSEGTYLTVQQADTGLKLMRQYDPVFKLGNDEEEAFRRANAGDLEKVYAAVAEAEIASLDARAQTIAQTHPLGLQIQQGTGVACGVLLARSPERCARLLAQLLTNELSLRIEEDAHATELKECGEAGSEATYRVVTKDPVLTNAFWTHFRP